MPKTCPLRISQFDSRLFLSFVPARGGTSLLVQKNLTTKNFLTGTKELDYKRTSARTKRLPASTPALSGWKSERSRRTLASASPDTGAGGGEISRSRSLLASLLALNSEAWGLSEPAAARVALPARACSGLGPQTLVAEGLRH